MLNFPNSPNVGDTYTNTPQSWVWDSEKWVGNNSTTPMYLPLTGGSISGNLSVAGTTTLHTATATTVVASDNSTNIATTSYVKTNLGNYLPLSGGTISGGLNVTGNISPGTINFGTYASSISPIAMNSYWWGFGWDGTVHWYVNGGDQGRTWMMSDQSGWVFLGASFRVTDFQSNNNVNAAGSLFCGGCQIYNASGWTYTPQALRSGGTVQSDGGDCNAAGVVRFNGMYWQNNGGWAYCPWQTRTDGALQAGGNVNSQNGGGNMGGWGIQTTWINGYWWSLQAADALYIYYNTSLQGGCYWSFCDERMKWNFRPVTRDCLASINAIELKGFDFSEGPAPQRRVNPHETSPDLFRWEDLPRKVKHIETGFIAQQLREIIPEAVPDPHVENFYLSVDMRPLVATLIGAVQQLTQRLAAVEAR